MPKIDETFEISKTEDTDVLCEEAGTASISQAR